MHQFATYEELCEVDEQYFASRWPYMRAVIESMKAIEFESCLELGTNGLQLVKDSDTMDYRPHEGLTYLHDAREPFPIDDGRYELFVALQVWEHLDGAQQAAFAEVMRVSRKAILSFPYLWDCPESPSHDGLGHETIREWTLGVRPVKRFLVRGRHVLPAWTPDFVGKGARAVYVFDFGSEAP